MAAGFRLRIIIDAAMIILILAAMSFRIIGGLTHELIGIAVMTFFILHNIFNYQWYKNIATGRKKKRIINLLNLILIIFAAILVVSGILHSEKLLSLATEDENNITGNWKIHALAAYWSFVLISLHIGVYWNTIIKRFKIKNTCLWVLRIFAFLSALYGIKSIIERDFCQKLILYYSFDFWHSSEPALKYMASCFSIMMTLAVISYYILKHWKIRIKKSISAEILFILYLYKS